MIQISAMDSRTRDTAGEIMGICTANNRTTANSVNGRRHSPLSLFDTSFQLCPSVHLRVRCNADRTFFAEEHSLYIGSQEQRRFCVKAVANRFFARNRTILTCSKLKMMSAVDVMVADVATPKLQFCGHAEQLYHRNFHSEVLPGCLPPALTFFTSWIWRPYTTMSYNMFDRLLPGLYLRGISCNYPYAEFMKACFQQMFRRRAMRSCQSVNCVRSQSPACDGRNCSSSRSSEDKPFFSDQCVGHRCESETSCGNSDVPKDCDVTSSSASEREVLQSRNASMDLSSNNNAEMLPSECRATMPSLTGDDAKDSGDDDDNDLLSPNRANCMSTAPCPTTLQVKRSSSCSRDSNRIPSSFFVRVSDSDSSECSDSDDADDVVDASSDDESDCWYDDDDDDDDSGWTSHANTAQCLLADLDPLQINGLYIPRTSNVPVSHVRCRPVPFESTAETEYSESERALKRINDTWHQWYNDDVKRKPPSCQQRHTKHVGGCLTDPNISTK